MWGRHFRPSDRRTIADPMSHTPTRHILSDARANWWLVSGGLLKNLRNHGLFAKKEKGGPKRKKREPPYGKAENAKSAFPAFPQGLLPETKKDLKKLKRRKAARPAASPGRALRALGSDRPPLTRYWIHSSASPHKSDGRPQFPGFDAGDLTPMPPMPLAHPGAGEAGAPGSLAVEGGEFCVAEALGGGGEVGG